VDIHLHEPGEMGAFSMELIIERTIPLGMQGKVIVSRAFCLGMPDAAVVYPLIDALAEARVATMTTASASRPMPPLKRLVQAGVVACARSDVVTTGGARALGLEGYGLDPGCGGDRYRWRPDYRRGGCTTARTAHGGKARPGGGPRRGG
jgi:hypothetical protein